MRVLITWGSKHGGTEGIARILGESLQQAGFDVAMQPAREVSRLGAFDAVILGGALYANRWHTDAVRLLNRHAIELREVPVWLFSSGPLDDSAATQTIAPTRQVSVMMERVGALGHMTFGGRLASDARGFPAAAMARDHAGDWRDPARIRAWAAELAQALPTAKPGNAIEHAAHSLARLLRHGAIGWAICAGLLAALLRIDGSGLAAAVHAVAVPLVFAAVAFHYFKARGAREPLVTALGFAAIFAGLELVVAGASSGGDFAVLGKFVRFWLPLGLLVLVTWTTGAVRLMIPEPKLPPPQPRATHPGTTSAPSAQA